MLAALVCAAWIGLLVLWPAAAAAGGEWRWPVSGPVLRAYANDNARPYAGGMHRGIDLGAEVGARVVAARAGSVTFAGPLGSSGLAVALLTADGRYVTSYLHLSRIAVARGAVVGAGDEIGAVGKSGLEGGERPHLHFGVREAGADRVYVDPLSLLPPPAGTSPAPPAVPVRAPAPGLAHAAPVPAPARVAPPRPVPRLRPLPAPATRPFERRSPVRAPAVPRARAPASVREQTPRRVPVAPGPVEKPGSGRVPVTGPAPQPAPAAAAPAAAPPRWPRWLLLGGLALVALALAGRRVRPLLGAAVGRALRPPVGRRPRRRPSIDRLVPVWLRR